MSYEQMSVSVVSMILVLPTALMAEESRFRFDSAKVAPGVVYQYVKSNIDGSHRGQVSLYVAAKDRLESLKWHHGGSEATLVIARLDWNRFSVRHFETWRLRAGDEPQRRAVLDYDEDSRTVVAAFGDTKLQTKVENWPWHSYDFDFASLNFTFRHLVSPKKTFKIGVTDVIRTDEGPQLADKGEVSIVFRRDTDRHGHPCREYSIDGPGLEHRGGTIWVRRADGVLVDYEIALPDEPGFSSGKLKLNAVERMTAQEWEDYKSSRLSAK